MSDKKNKEEIAAKEIIKILKTFFETKKHILLTAPPGHGKTWVINKIYDIFEFQKLFDKHKEEILQLKEELKQGTFEDTFRETLRLLEQKCDEQDEKSISENTENISEDKENISEDKEPLITYDIESIVNYYFRILWSVGGNHVSLYEYVVKYLEGYMSSKIPNHFNHGAIKMAPTGVAASNIDGMTYHSFFSLNIFSNSTRQVISDADSRIIQYLQNINGYGIADLLYGIPDGQERMKIIKDNDNLFRVINQEIIIFDEISMIYDLSLDLLWKLTHDLQDVVRKIHKHFVKIKKIEEYNDIIQKQEFYTGLEKGINESKRNYIEMMMSMDGLNLMCHIVAFFFEIAQEKSKTYDNMTQKKFKLNFNTLIEIILEKETYDKMTEKINDRKEKMKDHYNERVRCYLENLCLEMVYEIFCKQFQKMKLEVPHEIKLFYDVMRFCNNNYKFISNMEKNGSIKPIKFLFVGDFLQIQPFKKKPKYDRKFEPNEIAEYYLETKSIAYNTVSLYKDINSYFADVFAEPDNKIEKLTLKICKRQKEDQSDFRKLISAMRLGKRLSQKFRKLLESKIINLSVDELLTDYIDDKNNFTILSMCNSYTNYINNSLILRDHKGDIDLVINTLLEKNVIPYEGEQNIYLNNFISAEDIEKKIIQLCYITYFLKSSSIRRSFHITLDEKQIDFLEDFRDKLKYSIIRFLETNKNGSDIYDYHLHNLYRMLIDRWYEVECYNGKIKYKYKIEEKLKKNRKIDKIILTISLDDKYKVLTLKSNRNDLRKSIEDKIENILSKNNNPDLESDHKKFLDSIKDHRQIKYEYTINEKLKKIILAFYLDEERKILTSMDNLNDLRKSIEYKIENILTKINPDLVIACAKFLDDIKDKIKDILSKNNNPDLESARKEFLDDIEDKIENVLSKNINLSLESDRKKFLNDIEYKIENILSKNNNPDLESACKKFLDDIEDRIENVLSKINPDLESACKKFLDDIEDDRKITYDYEITEEKLKKIGLTFYLNKEYEVSTSTDNLNDLRKDIEDKIEDILTKINPDLVIACAKFLDDIKDNIFGRRSVGRRCVTLYKLKMKLKYHDETVYGKPIKSKIILPISENEAIMIHEIPIDEVIWKRDSTDESSNISVFVKDMKCMITKNKRSYESDTGFLYVNGSMGNFEEIDIYGRLFMKLKDRYSSTNIFPDIEYRSGNTFCLRFPIVPAYSISINKSQGLTIPDKVILNLNQKGGGMWWRSHQNKDWFFKLVVAISRCTKLENLTINGHIDGNPRGINDLLKHSVSKFIDYMFDDMCNKADPKSKLIFDIEINKKRCQSVLKEIHDLRKRRRLNE